MSILNYYVSGNTAEGIVNYLQTNIVQLEKIIYLKHPSEMYKTNILKQLAAIYSPVKKVEVLKSPLGTNYLDGVIILEKSAAILTDRIALEDSRTIELDLQQLTGESLETAGNEEIQKKVNQFTKQACENFATGLKIHDDLEAIYIHEMNFKRADELADNFIKDLLPQVATVNRHARVYHRLFGTNTPDGVVNEVPHLIEHLSNVYYIKGRAGTGKSTFMKKIAKACEQHGYDVELYHCSFDPKSLDMVLVRELDFCIFDSTDPHEFFPSRDSEQVVDLYLETVTPGTDEKFAKKIDAVNRNYKSYMKKGIQDLQQAGKAFEALEQKFIIKEQDIEKAVEYIQDKIN
ncbi:AAA family ATPase [Oceanobacillus sp. FSL K6-2867]|uniref:AAA family ATPase n=1 Tax=Oceanobacillus sp. FSL K6-2867 TaxID=2954748 RepID=UPI0030D75E67